MKLYVKLLMLKLACVFCALSAAPASACTYDPLFPNCTTIMFLAIDGQTLPIYTSFNSGVEFNHDMYETPQQLMSWVNMHNKNIEIQYRVHYGAAGVSSGGVDTPWRHYRSLFHSPTQTELYYNNLGIADQHLPPYPPTATLADPQEYVRVYFRFRTMDSPVNGPWRYMRGISVYGGGSGSVVLAKGGSYGYYRYPACTWQLQEQSSVTIWYLNCGSANLTTAVRVHHSGGCTVSSARSDVSVQYSNGPNNACNYRVTATY